MPVWWNWQTCWTQNPVVAIPYRFDPDHRHQYEYGGCVASPVFILLRTKAVRTDSFALQRIVLRSLLFNKKWTLAQNMVQTPITGTASPVFILLRTKAVWTDSFASQRIVLRSLLFNKKWTLAQNRVQTPITQEGLLLYLYSCLIPCTRTIVLNNLNLILFIKETFNATSANNRPDSRYCRGWF